MNECPHGIDADDQCPLCRPLDSAGPGLLSVTGILVFFAVALVVLLGLILAGSR
jgi:hypothetical protein